MPSLVQKFHLKFFGGRLQSLFPPSTKRNRAKRERDALRLLNKELGYSIITYYQLNPANRVSELCDKYGSDKGSNQASGHLYSWPPHTYADHYGRLFDHCRQSISSVFECGLGTNNPHIVSNMGLKGQPGASLRLWRDYFPSARIYGADIDRSILFEEERIRTYYVDQTHPESISEMWARVSHSSFDLIIDDGIHTYDAAICFFENSIEHLAQHGIYIIEDVDVIDLPRYKQYFEGKPYLVDFPALARPGLPLNSNSLVQVKRRS